MNTIMEYNLVKDLGFIKTGVKKFYNTKKYYSTGSIKGEIFSPEGEYDYNTRPSRANREVEEGDILQARMLGTNKVILIDKKLKGSLFSTGFFQFRPPKNLVIPKLLYYFLSSNLFLDKKDDLCSGSTQKSINDSNLEKIKIPLPCISKQKLIVAKLDLMFSKMNKINTATKFKFNSLDLVFEKILNDLTKHQAISVKLSEVCDIQVKLVSPTDKAYCNELHIGAGNIVSMSNKLINVLSAKEERLISAKFPFDKKAILYSKIRPYLRKVHLPNFKGLCSADIYPLIPNTKKLDRNYLYYLLLSKNFTDYAISGSSRAGMPKVNRNHLFAYKFQLPKIETQMLVVKKIETIHSNILKLKSVIQKKLSQIHSLKSKIFKQEFYKEMI